MSNLTPTRRTLVKGAAWTVPVISIAATAPAYAASVRKDPGINGWVTLAYGTDNNFDARFRSDTPGVGPDGAPFGLYVYDINEGPNPPADTVSGASITLWFRGTVDGWDEESGHSNRWSNPVNVGSQVKPDGLTYTGYRFTYNGSVPGTGFVMGSDGRLRLEEFDVTAESVNSSDATFWVERTIVISSAVQSFQRRNGERGPLGDGFPSNLNRSAQKAAPTGTAVL